MKDIGYTKENFIKVCNESKTMSEACSNCKITTDREIKEHLNRNIQSECGLIRRNSQVDNAELN